MPKAILTQSRLIEPPPEPIRPDFNSALVVDMEGRELTSHVGLLAFREADHRLGVIADLAGRMADPRDQSRIRYQLEELMRERVGGMVCGMPAQDHLDELAHDPTMRCGAWDRPGPRVVDERLGSQPTSSRLQDWLAIPANLEVLREAPGSVIARHLFAAGHDHRVKVAALDVDPFPIVGYGKQEELAYNGHYGAKVFLPMVASFAPDGRYDDTRQGNGVIRVRLYGGLPKKGAQRLAFFREACLAGRKLAECLIVRADAEFANAKEMNGLCADRQYFVFRIRNMPWLKEIADLYTIRPAGRPPSEGYHKLIDLGWMEHQGWNQPLRIILCVEDGPDENGQLALTPRIFFLITNVLPKIMTAFETLEFYRQRGTFEDRVGEWNATTHASLSARAFAENEATLLLAFTAFNFANLLRNELEGAKAAAHDSPEPMTGIDLGRFQKTFLNAVGSLERAGRKLIFHLNRGLEAWWTALWSRMAKWLPSSRFPEPARPYARPWTPPPAHAFLFHQPRL